MTDVTRYLWVGQITTDPQGTLVSFADYAALRDELLHTEMERDAAEMRSVAHLKMYAVTAARKGKKRGLGTS
jgi:hypothetical protein